MNDAKAKALIGIADKELTDLWDKSPAVIGSNGWGVTVGSREAGTAYVLISGEWIAEANACLSTYREVDRNPLIDQLSERLGVVIERRTRLFGMGMGQGDSLSDGMRTFVKEVIARAKKFYENAPGPAALCLVGAALILGAIFLLKR